MLFFSRLLAAAACLSLCAGAVAQTTQGAGATFPSKVYQRWAEAFEAQHGIKVNYKPTGSGDGVKQAKARSVAFAGTDAPLNPAELQRERLVQIPTAVGGIVPVVNLRGVASNALVLDGPLLADLFSGKVQRWNDARIRALNPGLALPAAAVVRIVRADRSGTSEGFSRYLEVVSPAFKTEIGAGSLPKWPGTGSGLTAAQGNDGVVKSVLATDGALGYVSFDRVRADKLTAVRVVNAAGKPVVASEASFRAAIRQSALHQTGDDLASLANPPGEESWPITLTTFVLFDAAPARTSDVEAALRFFYWAFVSGDKLIADTGFAPLPTSVQAKLASRFAAIKPRDGGAPRYALLDTPKR